MIGFFGGGGFLFFFSWRGREGWDGFFGLGVWGLGTWGSGREGRKGNEKGNWKECLLGGFFW